MSPVLSNPPAPPQASAPAQKRCPRRTLAVLLLASSGLLVPRALASQESPFDRGVTAAGLLMRRLDGVKRVLMIGAHPDDEDTALLTALARGLGAETAYLSLTRGDGGQNLIGSELFEGLGAIRTGELLAARSLDGGRQFFTRAVDYGFSKSAQEGFSKWPREELLKDVVWVIRSFRPHVVVSVFAGTPADGHGQHQVAGLLAVEAFDAAADPTRFPEQLALGVEPWQPTLLFRRARGGDGGAVTVETGGYDPLLGRSTFQLAMESRSRHRSQDQGSAQPLGSRVSTLQLVRRAGGTGESPGGLFAGVDTTLAGLASALPAALRGEALAGVLGYRRRVQEAARALSVSEPGRSAPPLGLALEQLAALEALARQSAPPPRELTAVLRGKTEVASRALLEVSGIVVDVRVADDLLVPGQEVAVEVQLWNGGPYPVADAGPLLEVPQGWRVSGPVGAAGPGSGGSFGAPVPPPARAAAAPQGGALAPGEMRRWTYQVRVPADAKPSRLYYLDAPREGDLYRWPDQPSLWGLPKDPPLLLGGARLALVLALEGGERAVSIETVQVAQYVGVAQATGEFRRPVLVAPALSLTLDPEAMVWPVGRAEPRSVTVALRSALAAGSVRGQVSLEVPRGWSVEPAAAPFDLAGEGAVGSFTFQLRASEGVTPGRYTVRALARTEDGRTFAEGFRLLDYPHIDPLPFFRPAETGVTVVPVRVAPGLSVGYVMGTGDAGPEALRQLGVETELLEPRDVREGDLSRFDVLVLGARAYEARTDLAEANQRVLDFARAGGTVVVQYNQYPYVEGAFAPYPVEINRPHDRVTDERAPVRLLDPDAPPLSSPNRITDEDFEGWVTERGLYFLGSWDARWVPLLEMSDPGEEPLRGSLLVAPVGEGLYVYAALSFFRQLPAGVPGAYRLFANLVSLDPGEWRRYLERRGP